MTIKLLCNYTFDELAEEWDVWNWSIVTQNAYVKSRFFFRRGVTSARFRSFGKNLSWKWCIHQVSDGRQNNRKNSAVLQERSGDGIQWAGPTSTSSDDLLQFFLRLNLEGTKVRHRFVQDHRRCIVMEIWGIETLSDLLNFGVNELCKIVGMGLVINSRW